MGYKVLRPTLRLQFEDTLAGAEVVCRSVPIGMYLELAKLKDADGSEAAEKLLRGFAEDVLVSWDLEEEDGSEIPATVEGLLGLEPTIAMTIITAWMNNAVAVPAPLDEGSDSGPPSAIPMTALGSRAS